MLDALKGNSEKDSKDGKDGKEEKKKKGTKQPAVWMGLRIAFCTFCIFGFCAQVPTAAKVRALGACLGYVSTLTHLGSCCHDICARMYMPLCHFAVPPSC